MLVAEMSPAPKKSTRTKAPKAAPEPAPSRADGRPKSKLTLAAERAALDAKRQLLLATLREHGWNLTLTARELEMAGASDVLRAIKAVSLVEEYEAHRAG